MAKKITLAVNCVLAAIIISVAAVCFYPFIGKVSTTEENLFYHGNEDENKVSLMFNVYWGTDTIYDILSVLDKYSVKCTFFIGGCWADDNTACLKDIALRGHELANHGYFHKEHDKLSYEKNYEEISLCHKLIYSVAGINMTLFAPPSGSYNKDTISAAESLGYKIIMWSADTIDWRDKDSSLIYSRAIKAKGGDFVLMHPMEETAAALEDILKYYEKNSLKVVTVSENLNINTI